MKFVLAGYGSRGDVEPCAAVGRELLRRGHDVQMAVPPNMLEFVESAGLAAAAYGPRTDMPPDEEQLALFRHPNPISVLPQVTQYVVQVWAEKSTPLTSLAQGADLLAAGNLERELVANVAEYHGIPVASLHTFPPGCLRVSWIDRCTTEEAKAAQRRALGLPETATPLKGLTGKTAERGSLEIQAYDEICVPGLAAEWAGSSEVPRPLRPFVGAPTLELPTDADDEVLSWIAAGAAPIYFGFGSAPVPFAETVAMVSGACSQLGERALICSGLNEFNDVPQADHVKIVRAMNHAAIFPACSAVVHHGGPGTTAAGIRAGIPTLALWLWLDQPIWAAAVNHLEVGLGKGYAATTQESLVADLRFILTPDHVSRAREVATQMTKAAQSAASAADLLEETARLGRSG
jgi:vancomycin aglycone glucosyltransferase